MQMRERKSPRHLRTAETRVVTLTPWSMVVRVTMDFFQHRYYRLSKILMMIVGQWPYQSTRANRGILVIFIILTASGIVPQVQAVVKYRDDPKTLLECFTICVFGTISVVKLFSFIVHSQKRLELINRIRTDWRVWARDPEVNILHGYAAQGEKIAIVYTGVMYSAFFVMMTQQLIPTIIDVVLKNGSASIEFPYPEYYFSLVKQKYHVFLIVYANVCTFLVLTVIVSNDVMLVIYVQHVCGIFVAVGHKLERIGNDDTPAGIGESSHTLDKKNMAYLISCIVRHNEAIEYADLIEASYTRTILITCGIGMIQLNGVGLQVLMISSDPPTTTRFVLFMLAIIFYFYIECYLSQILIDYSISIRYYIYNSQWYRLSIKAQKILQFMTMRCTVPCHLTAGKMTILSVRTFWLALKTFISYFGFLRSTQGL